MSEEPNELDELLDLLEPNHYDDAFVVKARKIRNDMQNRAERAEADAMLFRDALMQIIGLIESSESIPVHPTTGKILGRRPRAQQMLDIARSALGNSE